MPASSPSQFLQQGKLFDQKKLQHMEHTWEKNYFERIQDNYLIWKMTIRTTPVLI